MSKPDASMQLKRSNNEWLTRQLITDFFNLPSTKGHSDQRRLNYWLRFVPVIEDTPWLALGSDAMANDSQLYRDMRERADSRLLTLENPGAPDNNAFIMKMGEWLIAEFGYGAPCYMCPAMPMASSLERGNISQEEIRNMGHINQGELLRHLDGHDHNPWEINFDQSICQKVKFLELSRV